jgi:hypothetical protein
VRYTAAGDLPPGEGDGGGDVTVTCTGAYGDDRGTIIAYQVPFDQGSDVLNKVRFSLRDRAGNTGYSPIYNARTPPAPSPDFDEDGDVDQEDFGYLQTCFGGTGVLPIPGCADADLDLDNDVDKDDLDVLAGCMGGANQPPGC